MSKTPYDSSSGTPYLSGSTPSGSDTAQQPGTDSGSEPVALATSDNLDPAALSRAVCEAQRLRWQNGERLTVEQCLEDFPALQDDEEGILDLIYNEIVLREELGERPNLNEYSKRFPQFESELAKQFSVHRMLSPAAPSGSVAPASQPPSSGTQKESGSEVGSAVETCDLPPASNGTSSAGSSAMPATMSSDFTPPSPSQLPTQDHSASPAVTAKKPTKAGPHPDSIPGYEILGTLGRGGMGVVYRAKQIQLKREVALKMVLAGAHASQAQIDRFRGEAEAIAKLQHPNIVQVYEVGENNGQPYFSLEFVTGGALDKKIAGAFQEFRWSADITETLSRAMHFAHQAKIIHRDLKPANVLLTADGSPKITDFGLAKQLENEDDVTQPGQVMGTPSYMSPEQASGIISEIGPPTDVYALGAILYELLTGRPPFKGETPWDTVKQVKSDDPVPPSRLRPKVPRDLETICLKALEKPLPKRYATGEELAQDLRRYLNGEPILARRTSPFEKAVKFVRRKPWVAGALGALSLAVVALVGAGVLQYRTIEREKTELQRTVTAQKEVGDRVVAARAPILAKDLAKRDYPYGLSLLAQAESRKGDFAIPAEVLKEIAELRAEATRGHTHRLRIPAFRPLHERAAMYDTNITFQTRVQNVQIKKAAALQGLAIFAMTVEGTNLPDTPAAYFSIEEQKEILEGCYEMLLILADAEAEPDEKQTREQHQEQLEKALRYLDRARQLNVQTRIWYVRRAQYLDKLNRKQEAAAARQEMPKEPTNKLDKYLIGKELFELVRGRTQRDLLIPAMTGFSEALDEDPKHFWSHYALANSYLRLDNFQAARVHFEACRSISPHLPWLYIGLGFANTELGRSAAAGTGGIIGRPEAYWEKAQAAYDAGLAKAKDPDIRYAILNNKGLLLSRWGERDKGKLKDAAKVLQQAMQIRPKQVQAYFVLAEVYRQERQLDDAITEYNKALDLAPTYVEGYRTRQLAHRQKGDLAAALKDIESAIANHPKGARGKDVAEDYVQHGELLRTFQRQDDAIKAFDMALWLDKDNTKALRYRAMSLFAQAELARADKDKQRTGYQEAVKALDEFLQKDKPEASLYLLRGLAKAKLSQLAVDGEDVASDKFAYILGAVDDYTRALELPIDKTGDTPELLEFHNHPRAATHVQRGILYLLAMDAPKLAERDFVEAIKLNPKIGPEAYIGRGLCYVQVRGRYREAVADAEQALDEARQRKIENSFLSYNAARIYSLAAARIDQTLNEKKADPKFDVRPLGNLRPGYTKAAVQNLQLALASVNVKQRKEFWDKTVLADRAFLPLRTDPAFRQLAEVYAK